MPKYCYGVIGNESTLLPESSPGLSKICYQDIALVVEDYTADGTLSISEKLLKHERVLEEVMGSCVLVPIQFGIILEAEADARCFLSKNYEKLKALLGRLAGKIEVGLKIYWTQAAFNAEIEDEKIKKLKEGISRRGGAGCLELIEVGKFVAEKVEQERQRYTDIVVGILSRYAFDTVVNPAILPRMILNAAFLVEKNQEEVFDAALNTLYGRYEGQLIFKYTGPWPPYNFVQEEFTI